MILTQKLKALQRCALAILAAGLLGSCDNDDRVAYAETSAAGPTATPDIFEPLPPPPPPPPPPPATVAPEVEVFTEVEPPAAELLPPPPPAPPQVSGLFITVLSTRSATVEWTTEHYADSEVRWGRSTQLEETPILDPQPKLHHCVLLTGLDAGAVYYAQAVSRAAAGDLVESEVMTFQTFEMEAPVVRRGHPRLFFHADEVPGLKAKIAGPAAGAWRSLRSTCESMLTRPVTDIAAGSSYVPIGRAFAFAGLIGDDARFREKAEDIALECARLGTSGDKMDTRERMQLLACVYDWLYAYLSSDTRSRLRSALWTMFGRLDADSNDYEYVWGHSHGNHRPMLLCALALNGEHDEATQRLPGLLREYRDGFFPNWRRYASEGGSLKGWWYTTWTLNMELEVLAAVESAMGLGWHRTESWYESLVDWYVLGLRGDNHFLKNGDTRMGAGFTPFDWIYCMSVIHYYRNGRAKWLANRIAANMDVWGVHRVWEVLWDEAEVAPQEPSGSAVRLFHAAGHVILRDGWGDGAVLGDFRSSPDYTAGHTDLDNNSFTLFCRGGLAIDSGLYDDFGSAHHMSYAKRSIAHNTILVYDPEERFVFQGREYINDGGQRWRTPQEGLPRSVPPHIENVLDPADGYRAGGIELFEDAQDYAYALGDAAPSYARRKLTVFDRQFLWLKGVAGRSRPVVVVCDEVVSPSAAFKKTYLLHTQTRPTVEGSLVTVSNQGGLLYQQTLLPEAARLEVVGGVGREFWVAGQNYAPTKAADEFDDAGRYRVEVSSPQGRQEERFLHVLYACEAAEGVPPRAASLSVTGGAGCAVGDWAAVFGLEKGGVGAVSYAAPEGVSRHLLLRLIPRATYDLTIEGVASGQVTATDKGTVRLDAAGPVRIDLSLAP